jgi:hypothetical protein
MRAFCGVLLLVLTVLPTRLQGQASPPEQAVLSLTPLGARRLPPEFALEPTPLVHILAADSTRRRPFFLPRPGEHTAYWVGFGAGLALSPLVWCEGSGCGTVDKASISLLLGAGGALSGLLLSRTF